jgi:putative membrane protein
MGSSPTDHLANERTFLAWVRTSITIMAFGFVVARFGLLLRELSGSSGSSGVPAPVSEWTGVVLVLAGSVLLVVAFARFLTTRDDLDAGRYRVHSELEWALTALMVAVGVGVAIYLVISA